jgi:hypothetical protein
VTRPLTDSTGLHVVHEAAEDTYYGETIKMLVSIVMAGDHWTPSG